MALVQSFILHPRPSLVLLMFRCPSPQNDLLACLSSMLNISSNHDLKTWYNIFANSVSPDLLRNCIYSLPHLLFPPPRLSLAVSFYLATALLSTLFSRFLGASPPLHFSIFSEHL